MSDENVMDLLDSLDVKTQKQKPKKSNVKRKDKKTSEDILGFLDELDKPKAGSEEPPETTEKPEVYKQEPSNETEEKPEKSEPESSSGRGVSDNGINTKPVEDTNVNRSELPTVDPMASISSWWNKNKSGLWSKAQDAVSDAVNQARQVEALVRDETSNFSLNAWQTRLTSVLHTIVPPISRHEQLVIHVYHDMQGYANVDKLLSEVFDYVMDQVEGGGELQIVSEIGEHRKNGEDTKSLNAEKTDVATALETAKSHINRFQRQRTPSNQQEDEDTQRISSVDLAIQPVIAPGLLGTEEMLQFAVYLVDTEHKIELQTVSQALPMEWAQWLDNNGHGFQQAAIDPREWISGWVEDALNLAFGVIAQKYVTTRMGLTPNTK